MIWAIVVAVAVLVLAAVAAAAMSSPAKAALGLLGTGLVVSVVFAVVVIAGSVGGGSGSMGGFSHAQLEADRVMTEQMATVVGPGMESQMTLDGMRQRSRNDAYLRALEQHTYQVERMTGRVP